VQVGVADGWAAGLEQVCSRERVAAVRGAFTVAVRDCSQRQKEVRLARHLLPLHAVDVIRTKLWGTKAGPQKHFSAAADEVAQKTFGSSLRASRHSRSAKAACKRSSSRQLEHSESASRTRAQARVRSSQPPCKDAWLLTSRPDRRSCRARERRERSYAGFGTLVGRFRARLGNTVTQFEDLLCALEPLWHTSGRQSLTCKRSSQCEHLANHPLIKN
jgi:hypothetical protein